MKGIASLVQSPTAKRTMRASTSAVSDVAGSVKQGHCSGGRPAFRQAANTAIEVPARRRWPIADHRAEASRRRGGRPRARRCRSGRCRRSRRMPHRAPLVGDAVPLGGVLQQLGGLLLRKLLDEVQQLVLTCHELIVRALGRRASWPRVGGDELSAGPCRRCCRGLRAGVRKRPLSGGADRMYSLHDADQRKKVLGCLPQAALGTSWVRAAT